MIYSDDKYVQICKLNEDCEIVFTDEFINATREIASHRRVFVARLLSFWQKDYDQVLNFFGWSDSGEDDKYSGIDGEPMDIDEEMFEKKRPYFNIDGDWYADLFRSKLISFKIPYRLIDRYISAYVSQ